MGVDGIDKADIFDEYFDDDKPKITNFQKIKAMDIDEMAEFFVTCINGDEDVADLEYISPVLPDIYYDSKKCVQDTKQWLKSEVRE